MLDITFIGFVSFFVSLAVSTLIVFCSKLFLNVDRSLSDVQVAHITPTPRVGGLAIIVSVLVSAFIFHLENINWIVVASLPIFLIGVAEDFHFKTTPTLRYVVGAFSAIIGIFLSGVVLSTIDLGWFDTLLSLPFTAFIFTIFCIVGLINAVNLIDGMHGLASGISIIIGLSLFFVAESVDDVVFANLGVTLAAASCGLIVLNYPLGKIFLGDSGAYFLGFSLAWLMILLAMRHDELSKWSLLAILIWPIMETLFSIIRRKLKGRSKDKSDRMHFHHLVMRGLELLSRGRIKRQWSNPLTTLIILPLACIPALLGTLYVQSHLAGVIICVGSFFIYTLLYTGLLFLLKKRLKINF